MSFIGLLTILIKNVYRIKIYSKNLHEEVWKKIAMSNTNCFIISSARASIKQGRPLPPNRSFWHTEIS